jgi:prephenate dehydrogenase
MRAVCVIGLGLIGGSVLRAASGAGRPAWGATASEADAAAARDEGFEVLEAAAALRRAKQEDALVVIAVPLTAVREVLRAIAEIHPGAWLTDVVSVKDPVDFEVRKLAPNARYAGGHPMAGTSASGFAAGSAELFQGAAWAVTIEEATTIEAWREAAQLALDCGAHVVPTGGPLALSLAAGSFRDGTRVAGSNPELVRAMTEGNKAALLDAVDDALGRLGATRGSLASTGGLKSTLDSGHEARERLDALTTGEGTTTSTVRLRPEALARLRELGELGGRVTEIREDRATTQVPVT